MTKMSHIHHVKRASPPSPTGLSLARSGLFGLVSQQQVWPRGHRQAELPAPAGMPALALLGFSRPAIHVSFCPPCAPLLLGGQEMVRL